jgi:hypothetical protein
MDPLQGSSAEEPKRLDPITLPVQKDQSAGVRACQIDEESAELLHELNNVFVGMLLNAQVMEWKLPSYSRLKRNLHEIERNAQRGGELAKRLLKRLSGSRQGEMLSDESGAENSNPSDFAVARQEPTKLADEARVEAPVCAAPALRSDSKKVPHTPM